MAKDTIKMRAQAKDGVVTVKALMTHPMETGTRKDSKTGKLIPAHFIKQVTAEHNGEQVLLAHWSGGVSKNPYLSFKFEGGKAGDTVTIAWTDNQGDSDSAQGEIR